MPHLWPWGLLTKRGPASWHPIQADDLKVFQKAVHFCEQAGTPIEQLALQYAVHREEIPTTLVSTPDPTEIIQNIEWASQPLDWNLVEAVRDLLAPVMNKDWIVG